MTPKSVASDAARESGASGEPMPVLGVLARVLGALARVVGDASGSSTLKDLEPPPRRTFEVLHALRSSTPFASARDEPSTPCKYCSEQKSIVHNALEPSQQALLKGTNLEPPSASQRFV